LGDQRGRPGKEKDREKKEEQPSGQPILSVDEVRIEINLLLLL
jgi:hypothetical protein